MRVLSLGPRYGLARATARRAGRTGRRDNGGMSDSTEPEAPLHLVEVAAFSADTRYRLVRLMGVGWSPMDEEEFATRVRAVFEDIDLNDPEQVHWADRPGEWPR